MPRIFLSVLFVFITSNFAQGEPIRLGISTPDETAAIFLELFSEKFDLATEGHPEISEINNETLQNFVLVKSTKGSMQKEDSNLGTLLKEILTAQMIKGVSITSIKDVAFNWAKEKYGACTINGIVYRYQEERSLDKGKCSFNNELDAALSETRARNVFAKVKNPDDVDLKKLTEEWKEIEYELGGIDYNFIFPLVYDAEPPLEEVIKIISSDSNFVSSGKKAINEFFAAISVFYDGSPLDNIIGTLKKPGFKNAYYFIAVEEEPSAISTHSLLILDEHNQMYGLEVRITRTN